MGRLLASLIAPLLAGCYSVGYEPAAGLDELAVPLFENQTLRRDVEVELTRQVRRELLESTPLHLAAEGEARAILRGAVTAVGESVLVTGPQEEVLASSVTVTARFGVYEGRRLIIGEDTDGDGAPDEEVALEGFAEFNAALGQDRASATAEALRDLAESIVIRLQARWDDRYEPNDEPAQASELQPGRQVALVQREQDWFRISLPARQALRATLFASRGDLRLAACAAEEGAPPLADAELRDEGRVLHLVGGEGARVVLLRVDGDGAGAEYQLLAELRQDDRREPDSSPAEATRLEVGPGEWLLRGLQRDDDYVRVPLQAGAALRAALEGDAQALRLQATDARGAARSDVTRGPGGSITVAGGAEVLLRVSGDDQGRPYVLRIQLQPGGAPGD